jgi:hypothetical protein
MIKRKTIDWLTLLTLQAEAFEKIAVFGGLIFGSVGLWLMATKE